LTEGNINVLALDEVKSCEEALVKLVTRSQIRFTTNSAKLLPTSRPLLREIAHQLERCPGVVVVEGHTDGQGDREENVTLSLNRARAVVAGLVGLGVPATRVRAEGFGPDQPLATNATATGRAQNRRIEFRVARTGIRGE
jgi:outer membrane protein OmpA-like peptidoglycan-associated protein